MILMKVLLPTLRMKTPFFIFSLAETATVPPDVKAHLYTHAYKVRFSFVGGHLQEVGVMEWRGCNRILSSDVQVTLSIIEQHIWGR